MRSKEELDAELAAASERFENASTEEEAQQAMLELLTIFFDEAIDGLELAVAQQARGPLAPLRSTTPDTRRWNKKDVS